MHWFLTTRILLSAVVLLAGCTAIRYGLAPAKDDSLIAAFESEQAAEEFFGPFLDLSVDVIAGLSYEEVEERVERARAAGRPVPLEKARIASGTVVEDGQLVITAAHVVTGGSPIVLSDRGTQEATYTPAVIVWCSREVDLAALKPAKPYDRGFAWANDLKIGQEVFLVGLWGKHAAGRIVGIEQRGSAAEVITHSAPIRGGDSGGPLVTSDGKLAAINTRIEFHAIRYAFSESRRIKWMPQKTSCTAGPEKESG